MTESFAKKIISIFSSLLALRFGKQLVIFIISMLPILELRGGLIAASILNVNPFEAYIICLIGNIIPIPFILMFITPIFSKLKKTKYFSKLVLKIENKALSKKESIEKYKYLGLLLFVGIPLPGTGAWTGSLIACMLEMDKRKSFIYIFLGVIMASIIMMIFSYGLLEKLI